MAWGGNWFVTAKTLNQPLSRTISYSYQYFLELFLILFSLTSLQQCISNCHHNETLTITKILLVSLYFVHPVLILIEL